MRRSHHLAGAESGVIPVPYRVQAATNNSAVVVIVETANEALAKMAELIELGCSDVVTRDLDGQLVDQARLETEAAPRTP
jgi:hypothetical protein